MITSLAIGEMWGMGWKKERQDSDTISIRIWLPFTIKVRLEKNNQSPVENFASKSGENILSEVRLKC